MKYEQFNRQYGTVDGMSVQKITAELTGRGYAFGNQNRSNVNWATGELPAMGLNNQGNEVCFRYRKVFGNADAERIKKEVSQWEDLLTGQLLNPYELIETGTHLILVYRKEPKLQSLVHYCETSGGLSLVQVIAILHQASTQVALLHSQNIYHGCLDEDHVLISSGRVKLCFPGRKTITGIAPSEVEDIYQLGQLGQKLLKAVRGGGEAKMSGLFKQLLTQASSSPELRPTIGDFTQALGGLISGAEVSLDGQESKTKAVKNRVSNKLLIPALVGTFAIIAGVVLFLQPTTPVSPTPTATVAATSQQTPAQSIAATPTQSGGLDTTQLITERFNLINALGNGEVGSSVDWASVFVPGTEVYQTHLNLAAEISSQGLLYEGLGVVINAEEILVSEPKRKLISVSYTIPSHIIHYQDGTRETRAEQGEEVTIEFVQQADKWLINSIEAHQ